MPDCSTAHFALTLKVLLASGVSLHAETVSVFENNVFVCVSISSEIDTGFGTTTGVLDASSARAVVPLPIEISNEKQRDKNNERYVARISVKLSEQATIVCLIQKVPAREIIVYMMTGLISDFAELHRCGTV